MNGFSLLGPLFAAKFPYWCGGNPGCEQAGRVRYERQGQTTWGWVGLVLWVELYPPERYVDFLISVLVNMTLFGNRLFAITVNLR